MDAIDKHNELREEHNELVEEMKNMHIDGPDYAKALREKHSLEDELNILARSITG